MGNQCTCSNGGKAERPEEAAALTPEEVEVMVQYSNPELVARLHDQEKLRELFQQVDRNGDGALSGDELREAAQSVVPEHAEHFSEQYDQDVVLKMFDWNGDGSISIDEFQGFMLHLVAWRNYCYFGRPPATVQVGNGEEYRPLTKTMPVGAAAQPLFKLRDGGKERLLGACPESVEALLEKKGAKGIYENFVKAVCGTVRSLDMDWKSAEILTIQEAFRPQFHTFQVAVFLCQRRQKVRTWKWLEFVDRSLNPDYKPDEHFRPAEDGCLQQ